MKNRDHHISQKSSPRKPRDKILNEIYFIILTLLGLVGLVALLTYAPSENPYSAGVLPLPIINQAGTIGAYFADFCFSILGYSAYLIPLGLIFLGYRIHKNNGKAPLSFIIISIRFIAFLLLIAFVSAFFEQNIPLPNKGWIGQMLHDYFGVLFGEAAIMVYLSMIMISLSVASKISWLGVLGLLKKILQWLFRGLKTLRLPRLTKAKKIKLPPQTPMHKTNHHKPYADKASKIIKKPIPQDTNIFNANTLSGLPDLALLDDFDNAISDYSKQAFEDMSRQVELKLKDFGFDVSVNTVTPGPVVTQFELSLAPGVKVSQIMNLNKDLARALLVESVRIVDVIPGKAVIGLEIPNAQREMISLKEILINEKFVKASSPLVMGLGKDINGAAIIVELAKMPHLLVSGATGMGKSVGLNAMILSILFKASPEQVRLIMIDPKIVELACYADIPHLLTPVITDMNEAANALWWCVNEMERRYLLLSKFAVRHIDGFNDKLKKSKQQGEPLLDPFFNDKTAEAGQTATELTPLPLIVVVIEEYADMLGSLAHEDRSKAKRVEALIVRLAQKARAAGIHLIIATQRPSVDVITGLIKSNVPTRIAFKVASKVDSRTILDQGGAEQLLGMGDMLYMTPGISHLTRVHGAFVSDDEINRVVAFLRENSSPNYLHDILTNTTTDSDDENSKSNSGEMDALYDEAVKIVVESRRVSISSLQRQMRIGYNRAARIVEDMQASGVVSTMNSAGNRQVLAPPPATDD